MDNILSTKHLRPFWNDKIACIIPSKLRSITLVATKVHVIVQSFVVLTWMCDTIALV